MSTKLKVAAVAALLVTFAGGIVWALPDTAEVERGSAALELDPIALAEATNAEEEITAVEIAPDRLPLAAEELAAVMAAHTLSR